MKEPSLLHANDALQQWLIFSIEQETYGVQVLHVQEVLESIEMSPIPGAPSHVLGIINLRGKVITVNDPCVLLGLARTKDTEMSRIILLEWEGQIQGILVGEVTEIIEINESKIETATTGTDNSFIEGTYQQKENLYILLSVRKIMEDGNPLY